MISLWHYLILAALLFAISIVGIFHNRKNLIVLLMAIELMLLAVNLNFVAFSHYLNDLSGQLFVFFILVALEIGAQLWRIGKDFHFAGDKQQWGWAMHPSQGGRKFSGLAYPALRGANQLVNASGVLAAIEALRPSLPVTAQAVRNGLAMVELPGRFQIVPGEPALVLDVAHNPHSVAALAENLDAMGYYPVTHAVFGAMADKDLPAMLERIAPLIARWHLTDLPLPRASRATDLAAVLDSGAGQASGGRSRVAGCHPSPLEALRAAVLEADPADRIVVFGSFHTVGGVLKDGVPRLAARHLAN